MTDLEKILLERRPIFCKQCGGKLYYQDSGYYQCELCGAGEYDDFGKVKIYLEEHGPTPELWISKDTGVEIEIIEMFLKNGRLEIPEGSRFYINCERCGCALRFGRFCYGCTKELAGQLKGALFEQMGEQPKVMKKDGKMHYLDDLGNSKRK